MSLTLALNNALSGLNVNQQALSILSQNIANANTPGYSRKILNQQAQYLNGNGAGVRIQDVTRRVDEYLLRSIQTQASIAGQANVMTDYSDRVQLMLGNPGANNSLNAYTTNFFNSLQALAQTPDDGTQKTLAVNSAATLARQISRMANQLQDLRFQADQDLNNAIPAINASLNQIYELNKTISFNRAGGKSVTELEDQRDVLLADVSQYIDIQTITRSTGAINITVNGISLLDDSLYQLSYTPIASSSALANNGVLSAVQVNRYDAAGNVVGTPVNLITSGTSDQVVSAVTTGKLKALIDMRDKKIPQMLAQLDQYAFNLRDRVNAIHNAGVAFPGSNSYTGSRAMLATDYNQWGGSIRLAVLGDAGQPIPSPYPNQPGGYPPLLLDLSRLDSGNGAGNPSLQSIINEINQYYGVPQNKLSLGNLSNIRLASRTTALPGSPPQFNFDLDLENLSTTGSSVFVTGVTVQNSSGVDITSLTQDVPALSIDPTTGFETDAGSNVVTITTTGAHGLSNGDRIYLPDIAAAIAPATDLNGIPLSELSGQFFTISNATSTSFQIEVQSDAASGGPVASTGAEVLPPYAEIGAGESGRSAAGIGVDLSSAPSSPYYTITMNVTVDDGEGNLTTSQVSYRIDNSQSNLLNNRYAVRTATGDGQVIAPTTTQPLARAIMVDANGIELPKVNGQYTSSQPGYLKIIAGNSSQVIAIDSLDSVELGQPNSQPPQPATNRGFAHYFGLNNLFVETIYGTGMTNAALNFAIEQRIANDPSLISTGFLSMVQPGEGQDLAYTYERTIGDPGSIQQLASLGLNNILFSAAGGLGATSQTLAGYAGQIVGNAAANATVYRGDASNANLLLDGFSQQSSSVSGVNLDEELANTVIYQNAYSASARVITVANELFETLLQAY